jgi:hypothetical protein
MARRGRQFAHSFCQCDGRERANTSGMPADAPLKTLTREIIVHQARALTYPVLTECPVGLLIHFNVAKLTDGVTRPFNPRVYPGSRS